MLAILNSKTLRLPLLFLAAWLLTCPARAYSYMDSYIPPEVAYAADLGQTISLPEHVDINRASLNQLRALPGFDEEMALKILRMRPFEGIRDFYKMPGLDAKQIEQLIRQVQPRIIFK